MAQRPEEQEQAADDLTPDFPYGDLVAHPAWAAVDTELGELIDNDDVELMTARRYVVGAIVRRLVDARLTYPVMPIAPTADSQPEYRWVLQVEVGKPAAKRPARSARDG